MSNKIKAIKNIEDKYGAVLFGMALTHLVDIGARHLTLTRRLNRSTREMSSIP